VPAQTGVPERFGPGDGLLGQAVKDRRAFVAREVPEGYFAIGSALGQSRPRHLIVSPVAIEGTQRQAEELQAQSEELRVSNEELAEQSRALKESQTRLELQQAELEQTNAQLEEQTQLPEAQKDDLSRTKAPLETQARELEQASRSDNGRPAFSVQDAGIGIPAHQQQMIFGPSATMVPAVVGRNRYGAHAGWRRISGR
jgi:TolA-binding protein